MKKILCVTLAALMGLCAAATQRLYIEDFSISPGETASVEILLDNDMEFTAFQTDLYLPEGLTPVDGSFALTIRKSSSHTLSVVRQPDGAIRLMSYSLQVKPFSGNSGALLTFELTASDDFEGSTIAMRNIICTTVAGREIPLTDETCMVRRLMRGDVNLDGIISIADVTDLIDYLLGVEASPFSRDNADVDNDGKTSIADVTTLIDLILTNKHTTSLPLY